MTDSSSTRSPEELSELNTGVPHSARVWNYWLGGKDNFPPTARSLTSFARPSLASSTSPASRSFRRAVT